MPVCENCGMTAVKYPQSGLCDACYQYKARTGRNRFDEKYEPHQSGGASGMCSNCKQKKARAKTLCDACYKYFLQHKKQRPRKWWQRREECKNCGLPRRAAGGGLGNGRCSACRHYLRRNGIERPASLWKAPLGWCDCGHKATHANVPLSYMTVDKEVVRTELYNLCDDCYALENEPLR